MLELLIVIGRALALGLRGQGELVLENLALRQQLMAMKGATRRPHLRARDRLFWIALRQIWRNWRRAVVLVRPDTVVRWHRDWLRRRWTRRSARRTNGRPPVTREIRVQGFRLRLFDVVKGSWRSFEADHIDHVTWSKDSKYVY